MSYDRAIGVSALERVEALLANPAIYTLADLVPERPPHAGGRRRDYPTYMWLLFEALISVYGSARRVEAELSHPLVWNLIRKTIRLRFPKDPDMHLSAQPMRRHHYLYARNRYLTHHDVLAELARLHRELAADQARELRAPRSRRSRIVDASRPEPHAACRRQSHRTPLQSKAR